MNISFLLGDLASKGGIEKVTVTLAEALDEISANTINIISLYKSSSKTPFGKNTVKVKYLTKNHEISMYNRSFGYFFNYLFDFNYIVKKSFGLFKEIKTNKVDVIVSCDIKMTALALLSCMFFKTKVVVIEHFEYDVPNKFLKLLRKFLYKFVHAVVIQTDEDEHKFEWMKNSKIHVIPNIVDVKYSNNPAGKVEKKNQIIAIGRLTYQKGFDILLLSWSLICHKHPEWVLKIFGDGEDKSLLENIIFNNKIKNAYLEPFTDEIDLIYEQSKLFVLSSRYEGLGMVLIEALAHQLPCVSFDCPAGPKTIISDGYNGLLVPNGDVEKMAESISLLINNDMLRKRFIENSLVSIDRFSKEAVLQLWNCLFLSLNDEK